MNWKNSICLNLTLAKGLSILPSCITVKSSKKNNVVMLASKKDVILYKMEKEVIDAEKPMFFNQCFDKGRLKNFVLWFLLNYGESKTVQLVEQLKNVGFQYASKAGISLGIDDLKIPPKKNDLIYEAEKLTQAAVNKYASGEITGVERFQSLIDIWHRTSEFLKQEVINYFEATDILNPVYMMAFSGARGNISQVRQLVGMRGLMADPQGQIIDFPIRSNFREGLTLTEYIISSYGARKGIVDTALRTANAGYLTRRLVDVAQHVIISNFDCGTKRGIFLTNMKEGNKTIHPVSQRIVGRILARDLFKDSDSPNPIKIASRNDEVTLDLAFEIGKYFSKVFVRSALTCETSKQICQLCYGWSLAQGNLVSIGEAVGVVAAQSIGEPGTQLTMRTFHTGGVFSGDVSDQIKAPFDGIVEYEAAIPGTLIRTPEGRIAFLTKVEGYFYVHKPINNLDSNFFSVFTNNLDPKLKESLFSESKKFKIPSLTLLYIKNGQPVYAKEVIAQISTISRKTNSAAGLAEEAELTIKSECEGQFYSKSLVINETKIGPSLPSTLTEGEEEKTTIYSKPSVLKEEDSESIAIDKIYKSWTWGYAWILSGKIYEYKIPSLFFPKLGDFMNSKSYISQIEWKLNPSNGHNVFYDIHKRTPGNILNKKHYTPFEIGTAKNAKKVECDNVSPMQSSQILFFDLTKILYKKYGYAFQLSENTKFFKKSKIDSLNNPFFPNKSETGLITENPKIKSNKQTQKDFLFFIKSLTMLKTSNTRTELPYFLQWFPRKNQTLTGGYVLLETNTNMDSMMISQKSHCASPFERLHKFNTSFFNPSFPFERKGCAFSKRSNTLKAKKLNKNLYTRVPFSNFTGVESKVEKTGFLQEENYLNTNGNISFKLFSTLIKNNINKIKMNLCAARLPSSPALRATLREAQGKGSRQVNTSSLFASLTPTAQNLKGIEVKKAEGLESRVLWVSSSFFKIKLSSLTNCKTPLLFNTSKDSPLLYLTQPFKHSHFLNEQNLLLTPTLRATSPLTSEQEIPTQKDDEGQETKNTSLELSKNQSSIKKLNFLFFNRKNPMFLQTNRQGNIKGIQQYNFSSLPVGSTNKHVQNLFETEGSLLKLKGSNFFTAYSTLSAPVLPSSATLSTSLSLGKGTKQGKCKPKVKREDSTTKRINDKKRKLSCFKQFEFANLTTYCRFANTSLSLRECFACAYKTEGFVSEGESRNSKGDSTQGKGTRSEASKPIKQNTRIYFGTFSTFTTLIDNSFNDYAARLLRSRFIKAQKPEFERKRSLFLNYFVYTKESNFFASNYLEKEYKRFNKIQNKANFYSFMNKSLFQLTPCLQIHYIRDYINRHIKANLFNASSGVESPSEIPRKPLASLAPAGLGSARPTSIEKGKTIAARSISKKTELRKGKLVKKKAKISQSLVFSPSAYGALKKGWVVIPTSSNILQLWKCHKKRINPGQVLMDKMIFNMPILTECFLFNDIFNIEQISLPKSFSFGSSALVTNAKVQHLTQTVEDVNGLYWVKNNKSRYFMPAHQEPGTPSSRTSQSLFHCFTDPEGLAAKHNNGAVKKGKEDGGVFERVKAQIESNSLIKNNVKIGLFIQPVEEYTKMSNFEFKNYVYESNSNTLNNLCKNIESFDTSKKVRFGCWHSVQASRSLSAVASAGSPSELYCQRKQRRAKAIQSRVNQSFDSLLNWQKYKHNLYNKQNRTLQPLAKFTQKDFSVFSVALWTERTKGLFEKYLNSFKNLNKASASALRATSQKAKKGQAKKVTNTTKKSSMRSVLNSKLPKERFNPKKLNQKPLYVVSRKPLNLSPFLISFDNFSYENRRLSNLSEEIKNKKTSLLKPVRYQKVSLKQTFTNTIIKGSKTVTSSLFLKNKAVFESFKVSQKPLGLESNNALSKNKEGKNHTALLLTLRQHLRCSPAKLKPFAKKAEQGSAPKAKTKRFLNISKGSAPLKQAKQPNRTSAALFESPKKIQKTANKKIPSTAWHRRSNAKTNPNNPDKGYFNLSLSYQTYMVSYPPISKFDSLLDPSLNQNLNLILSFYLNKTGFGACSDFESTLARKSGTLSKNQNKNEVFCFEESDSPSKGTMAANSFYFNINNLIQNVFESPCFSYNLTYPIDKFTLYKKAKKAGPSGKTQNTQFFYSFPNNSLSGSRGEIQSNKPFAQTNYASPFIGEVVYTNKNLLNLPSITNGLKNENLDSLFEAESTLDSLNSDKASISSLNYSCMFLTQKDLISFYLPSNNFKQSLNINYGKNYPINDILVKFLNMTENTDSETIIKQLESFVRITVKDKTVVNTFTKMLSNRKDNFEIKIDNLEAGLPLFSASSFSKTQSIDIDKETKNKDNKKLNMSLLGDFIMYGDPINNTGSNFIKEEGLREASGESLAAICANGQIIHYNNKKITLRRGQPIFISPKSILHKNDGEFIDPKTPVITLSYQKLKTGDIIQGIPKVEQFLEARTTKRGRLFRDSLPSLLKALYNRYQSKLPLELAVRQSFYKIQQIIVDGVQRVYKSQGVTIADKHLEVIVKQMTSKVRIIDGAQTGFFPGEIVDLTFVEKINKFLIKKITYEPLVLGITRASLEVDSFLSASSFQQTTRILSEAAIYKKKDFLKGLKENVILGNLIPAGTGYLVNQDDIYSKI